MKPRNFAFCLVLALATTAFPSDGSASCVGKIVCYQRGDDWITGVEHSGSRGGKVRITGKPIKQIEDNLGICAGDFPGQSALSLGEGYSGLLPKLLQSGADVLAVDLWYAEEALPFTVEGTEMRLFLTRYHPFLISGDATALDQVEALRGREFQNVFSHLLVNNLLPEVAAEVVFQSAQLLTAKGQALHYGFQKWDLDKVVLPNLKVRLNGRDRDYSVEAIERNDPDKRGDANWLLILRRNR